MVTEEVRTWASKLYYKISNKRTGFAPLIEREDSGQCFQWYWADHQVVESWSIYVPSCILGTAYVVDNHVKCDRDGERHKQVRVKGGPFRVCMQAEVTADSPTRPLESHLCPPSKRGRLIVFAPTLNLVSSSHLILPQPRTTRVSPTSSNNNTRPVSIIPATTAQHLINIDTCCLRVAATTSLPPSPPSHHALALDLAPCQTPRMR
jgi:hypothetical protein